MTRYVKQPSGTWERLGDDFELALIIFEHNQRNEPIYFQKLLKITGWERAKVSRLSDVLADFCLIYGRWEKTNEGWQHCWHIDGDFEGFIRGLWNQGCEEVKPDDRDTQRLHTSRDDPRGQPEA